MIEKINSQSNSVSLHIRRGDYANHKQTNKHHGLCSIDYYNKAIKLIEQKIKKPLFFIFSDEIDWAKENLKTNHPVEYVEQPSPEKNYQDIVLMSKCKHNIIANSTFSWWGAWLNENKNKIVCAPEKWFNIERNLTDVVPESWIKL